MAGPYCLAVISILCVTVFQSCSPLLSSWLGLRIILQTVVGCGVLVGLQGITYKHSSRHTLSSLATCLQISQAQPAEPDSSPTDPTALLPVPRHYQATLICPATLIYPAPATKHQFLATTAPQPFANQHPSITAPQHRTHHTYPLVQKLLPHAHTS